MKETFSNNVKKELAEIKNYTDKTQLINELRGYIYVSEQNKVITKNEFNINRISKLLSNLDCDKFKVEILQGNFCLTIPIEIFDKYNDNQIPDNEESLKPFLRGCFLRSGYTSDPRKSYHLEILIDTKEKAERLIEKLKLFDFSFKLSEKNGKYLIYIKEGEQVSNFLAFIEAGKSVMKFEEDRVIKDVSNNVNRGVNLETSNVKKIINASMQLINDIEILKKNNIYNQLDEREKEVAELRVKYPDKTYDELGKLANPQISKQAVSHRLNKIHNLAKEV